MSIATVGTLVIIYIFVYFITHSKTLFLKFFNDLADCFHKQIQGIPLLCDHLYHSRNYLMMSCPNNILLETLQLVNLKNYFTDVLPVRDFFSTLCYLGKTL